MGYLRDSGHGIVYGGVILACGLLFGSIKGYEIIKDRLYEKASIRADINNDGITTLEEWKKADSTIDIHLQDNFNPRNLKISQLRRIVNHE